MGRSDFKLLVVEDEKHMAQTLRVLLSSEGDLAVVETGEEALEHLKSAPPDLVLLDIRLPGMDGMTCLARIKEIRPETEVVMVTATREVRTAVEAMKLGAYDYIEKPFDAEDLQACVRRVKEKLELRRKVSRLQDEVSRPYRFENIIGGAPVMKDLFERMEKVVRNDVPVLIVGESGTGKELVARAIHYNGARREEPFVAVNGARRGGGLIESELFGHEKGAFTGATGRHHGAFERADGGTLFLDEIGTMPQETQTRLLRAIEQKEFMRVGGEKEVRVDIRVVSATNVDIDKAAMAGTFRQDLLYRLNVVKIRVPPLKERKEDIPLLVDHFIRKHSENMRSPVRKVSPEAMQMLMEHPWGGNVRELENTVQLLVSICDSEVVEPRDLELPIIPDREKQNSLRSAREHADREKVLEALRASGWNQRKAARALGIHRNTINKLIQKYGIRKPE